MSSTGSGVLWLENRKDLEDLTEAPLHNVPAPEGSENPKAGVTLFYGFHAIIDGFQECYRIAQQTMCHIEPIELILDDGGHSAAGPVPDTILPELKILHLERCTRKLQDRVMNIWQEFLEAEGNPPNKSLTSRGVYVKNLLTERMDLVRVLWEHEDFNHLSAITFPVKLGSGKLSRRVTIFRKDTIFKMEVKSPEAPKGLKLILPESVI